MSAEIEVQLEITASIEIDALRRKVSTSAMGETSAQLGSDFDMSPETDIVAKASPAEEGDLLSPGITPTVFG